MMARHKSNHIQVAYANSADEADRAMQAKAATADALGIDVSVCGTRQEWQVVGLNASREVTKPVDAMP